ncbi:MAG: hypothetical protein VX000_11655 [Myxococcota bacterium]|nr:hypothetical protein [Myxococcota bacterium]
MLLHLLALATTAALGRTPDPYVGCRAEPLAAGSLIHRCPGLMLTEQPGPPVSPQAALAALRDRYDGPSKTIRDTTLTIDGDPLPALLVEGPLTTALLAALPFPGTGLRVLHCAPSDRTQLSLERCAALIGRASKYGLGTARRAAEGGAAGPDAATAAPGDPLLPSPPAPERYGTTDPTRAPLAATGPTSEGPRFRGRDVPEPANCGWSMIGQDVGALTCPTAVLVMGRVPVSDPAATLENLVGPHIQAIKKSDFPGRIKRITGSCRVDLLDGECIDLRLDPPNARPYRVIAGVVADRGSTWFATCRQTPPTPGLPSPCDRLLSAWPPPGVDD